MQIDLCHDILAMIVTVFDNFPFIIYILGYRVFMDIEIQWDPDITATDIKATLI